MLGSEDALITDLGVSRATIRQAARLLEREGVLRVRRGIKGGYFAARPNVGMVEAVFCAYLSTLGLDARHTGTVATALWIEAIQEAASANRRAARALAAHWTRKLEHVDARMPIEEVARLERDMRSAVFGLIDGRYIDLIFRINEAFARQQLRERLGGGDQAVHRRFVGRWKKAKLLELEALAEGDSALAALAAAHNRRLWMARTFG